MRLTVLGSAGTHVPHHLPGVEAAPGDRVEIGALTMTFAAAHHPVETLAVRVEGGDRVATYSADTAPSEDVVAAARGADLFVCDATWLESDRPLPEGIHCTGAEAGRMASAAGAGRLLVTHVAPRLDPADVAAEARTAYGGEVLAATDRLVLEV